MADKKYRLVLTMEELNAVKEALNKFVIEICDKPYMATSGQMEAMPAAADVLLTHFGG